MKLKTFDYVKVTECSGLDSGKVGIVLTTPSNNIKPENKTKTVSLKLADGNFTWMFVNRLLPSSKDEFEIQHSEFITSKLIRA